MAFQVQKRHGLEEIRPPIHQSKAFFGDSFQVHSNCVIKTYKGDVQNKGDIQHNFAFRKHRGFEEKGCRDNKLKLLQSFV